MHWAKKKIKDQNGSATLEFLGMVPLVLLIMVMLWQFLVGAFALMTVQSAANEAAKVYSTTENSGEALQAAKVIIEDTGDSISYNSSKSGIASGSNNEFTATIGIQMDLVFLPESITKSIPPIPINQDVTSRVIK